MVIRKFCRLCKSIVNFLNFYSSWACGILCKHIFFVIKVVKIGILCRIVGGRWDYKSQDRIMDRKILHIFKFKAKNILIMTLYVE